MRSRLEEIDLRNPELRKLYVTGPEGFVPSQAEVDALGRALAGARSGGRWQARAAAGRRRRGR